MEFELYEGAVFTTPKLPPKEQILNYKLPKKEQRWKPIGLPANWEDMNEVSQAAFAFEEDRKCEEGIWFYNNGVPTYITGDHYHYISWFHIDVGLPGYRDRDRRWFYHWHVCDNDKNCIGQCYGKLRRDGYSYRVDSIILNRARKTFSSYYGIISKTGLDAQEMFLKLTHAFGKYPSFFKPQVRSAEDALKELSFRTPQQKITFKTRTVKKEVSLDTKIDWRNTKQNAYDSTKQKILAVDEAAKWIEVNFEKWFAIGKTCVTLGGKIIGKLLVGSTVNEKAKGGANFESIWDKSNYREKNANGRTGSWLYRYFVPAYDGLEGFIDEYGMSVIDNPKEPVLGLDGEWITVGAKEYLENERRHLQLTGDTIGYFEELRQRPFTEEEMFRDPANENTPYDLERLYYQISYNDSTPNLPIVRGNFEWKGGIRDSEVVWHVTPQGKWLVYWMPKPEERNKSVSKRNGKFPGNTHEGLFSVDPYDHKYTTSKKKSKAASHGLHKLSFNRPELSYVPVTEYWFRPNDPYVLYEDMLMQCVFYGWEILGESNKPGCINYFRNRGYENYLMDRPAFSHSESSAKNQKEKWIPNTGDVDKGIRRLLVEHTASYVSHHVGPNDATGSVANFKFNNTLTDLSKFDVEKWTDYDLSVSFMIGVLGLDNYVPVKKKVIDKAKFFEQYDYSNGQAQIFTPKNKIGGEAIKPTVQKGKGDDVRKAWGI